VVARGELDKTREDKTNPGLTARTHQPLVLDEKRNDGSTEEDKTSLKIFQMAPKIDLLSGTTRKKGLKPEGATSYERTRS